MYGIFIKTIYKKHYHNKESNAIATTSKIKVVVRDVHASPFSTNAKIIPQKSFRIVTRAVRFVPQVSKMPTRPLYLPPKMWRNPVALTPQPHTFLALTRSDNQRIAIDNAQQRNSFRLFGKRETEENEGKEGH